MPGSLSAMLIEPLHVPAAAGLKLMLIKQEALGRRLEPQVLVWEKLLLTAMLEIVSVALPVFVSVTP